MDPRTSHSSRAHVEVLLAKGKLVGCLTTGQSKASNLDSSEINNFHHLLQAALADTTSSTKEFKKCIAWIVCHVAKSRRRVAALGDYLVKLAESTISQSDRADGDVSASLHAQTAVNLLLILDAVFFRIRENPGRLLRRPLETYLVFAKAIEAIVPRLVELAAPVQGLQTLQAHQDLARLLDHWTHDRLFTNRIRINLRNIARKAYIDWLEWLKTSHPAHHDSLLTTVSSEDIQNDFPKTHGLPEDSWFDLPVGAMVQAMKTAKPSHPLSIGRIKPLKMPVGSVDPDMMETVLEHMEECKDINSIPNVPAANDDEEFMLNGLGLRLARDPMNNDDRPKLKIVEGYYGFSVPFMKIFEKIDKNPPTGPERPQNWIPLPPPEFVQPPPYHMNIPPNVPPPPPGRDVPYNGGGNFRQNDYGRGNGGGWRGGENRGGGGGGNWRGRGRGGGGYRPY